jgi:transposase
MDYIEGTDRDQTVLFPESLEEYVSPENPVRVIDAFVESLDLGALGFRHAALNETGRPPYHPAVLLKLYVYGYLNRIRSPGLRLGQAAACSNGSPAKRGGHVAHRQARP